MEKERIGSPTSESQQFIQIVKRAQSGDKKSMEEIISFFKDDIEYLSRFIKLPSEEAVQELKTELIKIVYEKL